MTNERLTTTSCAQSKCCNTNAEKAMDGERCSELLTLSCDIHDHTWITFCMFRKLCVQKYGVNEYLLFILRCYPCSFAFPYKVAASCIVLLESLIDFISVVTFIKCAKRSPGARYSSTRGRDFEAIRRRKLFWSRSAVSLCEGGFILA